MPDHNLQDQSRWNAFGKTSLEEMHEKPETYYMNDLAFKNWVMYPRFLQEIGDPAGQKVLELGCGWGKFGVLLATKGADVVGLDIGHWLVRASQWLGRHNLTDAAFIQADMTRLPFKAAQFDLVFGVSVLHHLPAKKVQTVLRTTHRLLAKGGKAIFFEPVENSAVFNFLQNLVPIGHPEGEFYRPSILHRRRWKDYLSSLDDRPMRVREFRQAMPPFSQMRLYHYGLLNRLAMLTGRRDSHTLLSIDRFLLKWIPPLRYLAQEVLVIYEK